MARFKQEIQQQSLTTVWDLESELLPILIKMRQRGVRVQVEQAESLKAEMLQQEKKLLLDIKKLAGVEVDIWKARNIALAFDKLRIDYPRTEKTKEPSFTQNWLFNSPHKIAKLILQARELNKFHNTFYHQL